jgi:hypothetical protein
MSEMLHLDLSLLKFAYIGMKKLSKNNDPKITLPELLLTAHKILQKIELINRKGDKVKFVKNGIEIDRKWLRGFGDKQRCIV